MTPGVELSLPLTLGSGLRLFRKHIVETTAQIQWVQRLLGEVVKAVVWELRKKQREPQKLEQEEAERAPETGADSRVSQGP